MKHDLEDHTHVAVAYVNSANPNHKYIPSIVAFPVTDLNKYEFRVGPYLSKGETINIDGHKVHLISVDSIQGKRYGRTAIVRKNLLNAINANEHSYDDVKVATEYLTVNTIKQ